MTVAEIIEAFEEMNQDTFIQIYDVFGGMNTSDFSVFSWRGSYDLPAVQVWPVDDIGQCCTVGDALENLKACDGKEVIGYKGGNFVLSGSDTLFLVASPGVCGSSVTIGSVDDDGFCTIELDAY